MQKPLARPRIAWCRPPAGLNAWSTRPSQTACAAATEAPQTAIDASCMPAKTGVSPGPSPNASAPRGSGSADRLRTTST